MNARIFSWFVDRVIPLAVLTIVTQMLCSPAQGQNGGGYYTDPATGIMYQRVTKTVERPVVETTISKREQTVFRPQTVTESRPHSRTVYAPVVEYKWEPRLSGRWNPFQQPTVTYHHVPRTHWECRNELVEQTNTRTEWVAEKRTIDVPQRIVRIQREQKVDYEPVAGQTAPPLAPSASSSLASRLRPLAPGSPASVTYTPQRLAASTVGQMSSDPPERSIVQGGMPAQQLVPTATGVHGQPLPPSSNGIGVANIRPLPFFR